MGLLAPGKSVAQSPVRPSGLYVQEIQLAQEKNQRALSLHFSRPPDSVHAFTLRLPTRLVIDVRGEVERSASATHSASDALITRVRVGSHPHYTRFVLDLKAEQLPPFSVEQRAHVVTATLDEWDEMDNSNANAEQGNTQVLFARVPKASSQSVPPRPAQAPASPAPTVLAKKVTKKSSPTPSGNAACSHTTCNACQKSASAGRPLTIGCQGAERGHPAQGPANLRPPVTDARSRQPISKHFATAAHRAGPNGPRKKRDKKVSVPTPSSNPSCPHTTRDARQRSSGTGHLPLTIGRQGTERGYPSQSYSPSSP